MIYVSLDTETTGLSFVTGHVIEIGAVAWKYGDDEEKTVFPRFHCYVRSPVPVSAFIQNLTGITQARLDADGILASVAIRRFNLWLIDVARLGRGDGGEDEAIYLLGQNIAAFDMPFLLTMSLRSTQTLLLAPGVAGVVDLLLILKPYKARLGLPSLKLGVVYDAAMGRPLANAHSAIADAVAVLDIVRSPWFASVVTPGSVPRIGMKLVREVFWERFLRLGRKYPDHVTLIGGDGYGDGDGRTGERSLYFIRFQPY